MSKLQRFKSFIRISLGLTMILLSLLATVVSTGLSIAFFQGLVSDPTMITVVYSFIILLQSMVFIGSISKGVVYQTTPQHYNTIKTFTNICFIISVLSTISFFNQFSKIERVEVIKDLLNIIPFFDLKSSNWLVTNLTNMTLIWISCIVLDLMSMVFPSIGSDLISKISTRNKIEINDIGYIVKLYRLVTHYPKKLIDKKCIEYKIIKMDTQVDTKNVSNTQKADTENDKLDTDTNITSSSRIHMDTNTLHKNNVTSILRKKPLVTLQKIKKPIHTDTKNPCIEDMAQCNDKNEYIQIQNKMDTSQNKMDTNKATKDTKESLQNEYKSLQNKKDTKSKDTLQNKMNTALIKNIDDYIIKNYKESEKINVSEIKKHFDLPKQSRLWNDKIRNNLKSVELRDNKKLYRIAVKDIIENIAQ